MKKLTFICLASLLMIASTGCSDRTTGEGECMHCAGCFNSWTECESDWNNTEITWKEHRDQMIAESQNSSVQCRLVE